MKNLILFALSIGSCLAMAATNDYRLTPMSLDLVAPTVPNTASVSQLQVGMIVFDASANGFAGLTTDGTWTALNQPEKTVRIEFGGASPGDSCTSDPCTIQLQTGSWATAVNTQSNGGFLIHVTSGFFTEKPTCVCNAIETGVGLKECHVDFVNTNASQVHITTNSIDSFITAICVGH